VKTKNIEHKKELLKDTYNNVDQESDFNTWLEMELENDPDMGRFLTGDCDVPDFDLPDDIDELFDEE
jgi:hypothetical protein